MFHAPIASGLGRVGHKQAISILAEQLSVRGTPSHSMRNQLSGVYYHSPYLTHPTGLHLFYRINYPIFNLSKLW